MQTILTILQVFLSIGLIALILLQHGRGADAGAAFGSGASATVFGARGSASFLSRLTAILATLFFLTSMGLAYYAARTGEVTGLMDKMDKRPSPVQVPGAAQDSGPGSDSDIPAIVSGEAPAAQAEDVPVPPAEGAPAQQ